MANGKSLKFFVRRLDHGTIAVDLVHSFILMHENVKGTRVVSL